MLMPFTCNLHVWRTDGQTSNERSFSQQNKQKAFIRKTKGPIGGRHSRKH